MKLTFSTKKKQRYIAISSVLLLVGIMLTSIIVLGVHVRKVRADGLGGNTSPCYMQDLGACDGQDPNQCVVKPDGTPLDGSPIATHYMSDQGDYAVNVPGPVAKLLLWYSATCHTNWAQIDVFRSREVTLSLNMVRANQLNGYNQSESYLPVNTEANDPNDSRVKQESHTLMLYVPDNAYSPVHVCATLLIPSDLSKNSPVIRVDQAISQDSFGNTTFPMLGEC